MSCSASAFSSSVFGFLAILAYPAFAFADLLAFASIRSVWLSALHCLTFVPTPSSIWLFLLLYRAFPTSLSNFSLSCTGLFPLLCLTLPFLYLALLPSPPVFFPVLYLAGIYPLPYLAFSSSVHGLICPLPYLAFSCSVPGFLLYPIRLFPVLYLAFPLPYLAFSSPVPGFLPYPIWISLLLYLDFSPTLSGFCFFCTWISPLPYLGFASHVPGFVPSRVPSFLP